MKLLIDISEKDVKRIGRIRFLLGGREDRELQLNVINAIKQGIQVNDKSSRKDKYTMEIEKQCLQQGWQCPICKRIYSPTTTMCFYCGNQETITITDNVESDVKARMVKDVAGSDAKIKILRDAFGNEYESD